MRMSERLIFLVGSCPKGRNNPHRLQMHLTTVAANLALHSDYGSGTGSATASDSRGLVHAVKNSTMYVLKLREGHAMAYGHRVTSVALQVGTFGSASPEPLYINVWEASLITHTIRYPSPGFSEATFKYHFKLPSLYALSFTLIFTH